MFVSQEKDFLLLLQILTYNHFSRVVAKIVNELMESKS